MPNITAYAGTGTLLSIQNTAVSPTTWTAVAQILDLGGIKQTRTRIDASTHNYAADQSGYDDFILGLKKGGSFPCKVAYDPNNATHGAGTLALRGLYESGSKVPAKVTLGNVSPAVSFTITVAVSEIGMDYPLDGLLAADAKFEISGAVTQV